MKFRAACFRLGLIGLCLAAILLHPAPQLLAAPNQQSGTTKQLRVIKIPAPEGAGFFGEAMAYDGKTLVVGAPSTDVNGAASQGVVYVYSLDAADPENWQLDATLTYSASRPSSYFGEEVAVKDNLIAIGVPRAAAIETISNGLVYFAERADENSPWALTQWINNVIYIEHDEGPNSWETTGHGSYFGHSIAIASENHVYIGAPGADIYTSVNGVPYRYEAYGGVFPYQRASGDWYPTGSWLLGSGRYADVDDGNYNADFGKTVAVDANGADSTLVIGAPGADYQEAFDKYGKAYIYRGPMGGLTRHYPDPRYTASGPYGLYGNAVAADDRFVAIAGYSLDVDSIPSAGLVTVHHPDYPTRILSASDADAYDFFGVDVAIDQGHLIVGAPQAYHYDFGSAGAAYHFVVDENGEWQEVAKYTSLNFERAGQFGQQVAIADGLVVVSSPYEAERDENWNLIGGQGAVYLYYYEDVPPTQSPVGKVPENIEHLAHTQVNAQSSDTKITANNHSSYLPIIGHGQSSPNATTTPVPTSTSTPIASATPSTTPSPTPTKELLPTVQQLQNDGVIQSNYGAYLGVLPGTLPAPLDAYLVAVSPETIQTDDTLNVVGHYYALGTITDTLISPVGKPLVVGLPVPIGVNPNELSAAVMLSTTATSGHGGEEPFQWATVPGAYDPVRNLFSFILSDLSIHPHFVTLVTSPNSVLITLPEASAQSLDNSDSTNNSEQVVHNFFVQCSVKLLHTDPLCDPTLRQQVGAAFYTAYQDFKRLGFKDPSLPSDYPYFDPSNPKPGMIQTQRFYNIMLLPPPCDFDGEYNSTRQRIRLCMDAAKGIDQDLEETIRHELFHAIQYSYAGLRAEWEHDQVDWTIEGTAAMSERSSDTLDSGFQYNRRMLDVELDFPYVKGVDYAYGAQDFWVYTGKVLGESLAYLIPIFEVGGTPQSVDSIMGNNLEGAYWAWIKNYAYEKDLGADYRASYDACELETRIIRSREIWVNNGSGNTRIDRPLVPLAATAYTIAFEEDMSYVSIDVMRGGPNTKYKLYLWGDGDCTTAVELEGMQFSPQMGDVVYVIVANTGYEADELHRLEISMGEG